MSNRPVFAAAAEFPFVNAINTEFTWVAGLSKSQNRKCSQSLRAAFHENHPELRVMEVSRASDQDYGISLSAFNMPLTLKSGKQATVETAYQGGKVFELGGPYADLLDGPSAAAKKDPRLKESGHVVRFELEGETFPLTPYKGYYLWLYLNSLKQRPEYAQGLMEYDAFTDIYFNPKKGTNCQAEACAIYVGLHKAGLWDEAMKDQAGFARIVLGCKAWGEAEADSEKYPAI